MKKRALDKELDPLLMLHQLSTGEVCVENCHTPLKIVRVWVVIRGQKVYFSLKRSFLEQIAFLKVPKVFVWLFNTLESHHLQFQF